MTLQLGDMIVMINSAWGHVNNGERGQVIHVGGGGYLIKMENGQKISLGAIDWDQFVRKDPRAQGISLQAGQRVRSIVKIMIDDVNWIPVGTCGTVSDSSYTADNSLSKAAWKITLDNPVHGIAFIKALKDMPITSWEVIGNAVLPPVPASLKSWYKHIQPHIGR